jgi:dUTPase
MLLTQAQIRGLNIVSNDVPDGWRPTSYDATVGDIVIRGEILSASSYVIPPRGVVWVVSNETFAMPDNVTALATLKTTWTHKGLLALNVGIVDPRWTGCLSTALVNLSKTPFPIAKGNSFFRVVFNKHRATGASPSGKTRDAYLQETTERSALFARTFLDMESLSSEIAKEILGFPRLALVIGVVAVLISIAAIFAPIGFSTWSEYRQIPVKYDQLSKRVDDINADSINKKISDLERELAVLRALNLERQKPAQIRTIRQYAPPHIVVNANQNALP